MGYSATDIITTLFRVTKNAESHEFVKLEFLRVSHASDWGQQSFSEGDARSGLGCCLRQEHGIRGTWDPRYISPPLQEIGFCHMRITEGVDSRLQLSGLLAKMCKIMG